MTIALKEDFQLSIVQDNDLAFDRYLGPAQVLKIIGKQIHLKLLNKEVEAISAFSYPYRPEIGDIVLVISQAKNFYVIGVLEGTGKTTFIVPGDLELQAPRGNIGLLASQGIQLRSPLVKVVSKEIQFVAATIIEKFEKACRWVSDTCELRAGRVRSFIEQSYRLKAGKIIARAKGNVKIDGNKINLG